MLTTKTTTNSVSIENDEKGDFPVRPLAARRRRPSHPGAVLRDWMLPESHLTQTELAARLGVSRRTINQIVNELRPVTPDLANRLGRFFGNGAEFWMRLQQQMDLWDTLHADERPYQSIEPLGNKLLSVA